MAKQLESYNLPAPGADPVDLSEPVQYGEIRCAISNTSRTKAICVGMENRCTAIKDDSKIHVMVSTVRFPDFFLKPGHVAIIKGHLRYTADTTTTAKWERKGGRSKLFRPWKNYGTAGVTLTALLYASDELDPKSGGVFSDDDDEDYVMDGSQEMEPGLVERTLPWSRSGSPRMSPSVLTTKEDESSEQLEKDQEAEKHEKIEKKDEEKKKEEEEEKADQTKREKEKEVLDVAKESKKRKTVADPPSSAETTDEVDPDADTDTGSDLEENLESDEFWSTNDPNNRFNQSWSLTVPDNAGPRSLLEVAFFVEKMRYHEAQEGLIEETQLRNAALHRTNRKLRTGRVTLSKTPEQEWEDSYFEATERLKRDSGLHRAELLQLMRTKAQNAKMPKFKFSDV